VNGDVEAHSESDMVERSRHCLVADQSGPFADGKRPHTPWSSPLLRGLPVLQPATLATPVVVINQVLSASAS